MRARLPLLLLAVLATLGPLVPGLGMAHRASAQTLVRPGDADAAPAADSLAAYGYGDTSLRGTYGSADVFVPLAPGTTARSATVTLHLDTSTLLAGHSTFTLQAGGVDVASTRLIGSQPQHVVTATVPAERIGPDGLALGYRGYLRLTDDDCEEGDNPGQWVTVLDDSTVTFDTVRTTPLLSDVPSLFQGPSGEVVVGLAVPDGASGPVLQAAVEAAWQVGRWRGAAGGTPLITTDVDDLDDHSPLVAVGTTSQLADMAVEVDPGDVATDGEGALLVINETRPTVVVTGADAAGLARAVEALRTPAVLSSLTVDAAALTGGRATGEPSDAAPWTTERTTFAQLGIPRLSATGTGVRELFATIDRPTRWDVTGDVVVALDVDASTALRGDTSTIQLLVNGQDAGTQPLSGAEGVELHRFRFPAGLADRTLEGRPVRALDLVVRMVLDLPEARCSAPEVAAAQASVLPTSTVEIPHDDTAAVELARFPHPLTGEDGTDAVALVLPDGDLDATALDTALQLAAALGRWAPADGQPPVVRRSADDQARGPGVGGTIAVGAAAEQLAADVLPDERPPSTAAVQATLAVTDTIDGGRPTLLVLGQGDGPLVAARVLADRAVVQQLDGDVVVVQSDAAITLRDRTAGRPPPELAPPAEPWFRQRTDHLVPAVVVGVALLAMLVVLVVVRWRPLLRTRSSEVTS